MSDKTQGQVAHEAKIEDLKTMIAESAHEEIDNDPRDSITNEELMIMVNEEIEKWENGELEAVESDPTVGVDVQPEEAGAGQPDEAPAVTTTEIICDDGLPILTPQEVRSKRDGLGISRPMLIELTGINGYRCWAAEQAHKADEIDVIEWRKIVSVVLRKIDRDGLPEEMRPKARKARSATVAALVDEDRMKVLEDAVSHAGTLITELLAALEKIENAKSLKEAKALAMAACQVDNTEVEVTIES